jgi:voltage-gated potassium channel
MAISVQLQPAQTKDLDGIEEIQIRAQRWRLIDCSEETLGRMKTALQEEIATLGTSLQAANDLFEQYIQIGNPSGAMSSQEEIEGLSNEWKRLKKHLHEVEEAILERSLRRRLSEILGGEARVNFFDGLVLILILIVVSLTLIELLIPLTPTTTETIILADTAICFFLLGEFFLRLIVATDKKWYIKRYWIDFVSSLPLNGILQFGRLARIARFARLVRLMRLSRAVRVLLFASRGLDKIFRTFELNLLKRSVIIALALLIFGALSIAALESDPHITSFNDSLWWSFATVVTGGFADLYNPITPTGRFVTVGLILLGLTVTGIFTASLTSVLVEDDSSRIEQRQLQFQHGLNAISHKLDLLAGETREAMVALEQVAQAVSNQSSQQNLAQTLTQSLTENFYCLQASVHLFEAGPERLRRIAFSGLEKITPPAEIMLDQGFVGHVAAKLHRADLATVDLEPSQELCLPVQGIAMVCPMVAESRLMGCLHLVLPSNLANDYLYTRVPMTLAHQAAVAFLAKTLLQNQPKT